MEKFDLWHKRKAGQHNEMYKFWVYKDCFSKHHDKQAMGKGVQP